MFVVFGVTGNTGSVTAGTLLAQGKSVRVVVHSAARGEAWKAKGADVIVADLEDHAALERALKGAEGAYVLFPPMFGSSQVRADNDRRAKNVAAAIAAVDVGHVVLLSSIGAQHPDGTGSVLYLHDAEATIARTVSSSSVARAVTFLRAAYFMENWILALQPASQGVFPTFLRAERAIPMVATRDIGLAAARLLAEGGSGARIVQLAGPREYAPNDVASSLERLLGKVISVQQHPDEAMAAAMRAAGMNDEWSRLFQELTHGFNTGRVAWEAGHSVWRGKTDIEAVFASLLGSAK
jgi:uncharacterized protein YbjT (DUF2867 family)